MAKKFWQLGASDDVAEVSDLPYRIVQLTVSNGAATLLDRASNKLAVSSATTLTLPAALGGGRLRDLLVRIALTIPEGETDLPAITFAASGNESLTYETDGDEFPAPDAEGTWLYSFTESDDHKFAVSLKKLTTVAAPAAQSHGNGGNE